MSATLSFFKHAVGSKLGDVGDSLVGWYAEHDPESASAADIAQLGERANALAHRIAEIQGKIDHDKHAVDDLTLKLTRDKQAAGILGGRLRTAQETNDAALVTQITAQLTPMLTLIETIGGDDGTGEKSGQLFDAQQVYQADLADLAQFRNAHTRAMNDWTTARTRLDQARVAMERATQQKHDAEERQAQAQHDAGLLQHSAAAGGIALAAMQRRAEAMQTDARAATIQADSLRQAKGTDVEDTVSQVLAGESAQHPSDSALDRLSRLTGGH